MRLIEPATLLSELRDIFVRTGFAELVGGEVAFETGIADLKAGALVIAAELVKADQLGAELSDAVFDHENYPHVAQLHGVLADVLVAAVPGEVQPWARRVLAMGPLPQSPEVTRVVASMAARSPNVFHRALARLALFEGLCLQQKLVLRASGVHLEVLNGRSRDVETLAEQEMRAACELAATRAGLLSADDPGAVLAAMAMTGLSHHVDRLRDELTWLSGEVREVIGGRRQLVALLERVDADDAVLIRNVAGDLTGEERLTPAQLRARHPVLLGHLSDAAIHQRVNRMPERVRRRRRPRGKSLIDMILEAANEVRP